MQNRGYLIRFIDIGLILLFGFLMISDLTVISQITLPGKNDEATENQNDADQMYVGVSIEAGGIYTISDLATQEPLYVKITAAEELEFFLKTLKDRYEAEGRTLSVLIEPGPESAMQHLINALDVCERLTLTKNINTENVLKGVAS